MGQPPQAKWLSHRPHPLCNIAQMNNQILPWPGLGYGLVGKHRKVDCIKNVTISIHLAMDSKDEDTVGHH